MNLKKLPTLRTRLALVYLISTTVTFLVLTGLFSSLLWVALHSQIDHHIHIVTTQAEQIINNSQGYQQELLLNNLVQMEGMSVLLLTQNGEIEMQKYSRDIVPLSTMEIAELLSESAVAGNHPQHFTFKDQRYGSSTLMKNGQEMLLAVGYSTKILQDTFNQMLMITLAVMLLILVPLSLIWFKLLHTYLYPLEVIADTAQEITTPKKLSRRVTGLPVTKEVFTIVTSFNAMLSRLQHIFTSEHEFFSDAAHTLKTPLAVLRAKVEGLNKESEPKKQEMLQVIDGAVDVVQDLLLISRIETGEVGTGSKLAISDITHELLEIARSLADEKQVTVTADIQPGIFLWANERLIKKAWGNIVHNALEYVNKAGMVTITLKKHASKVTFTVTNTGGGMQSDEIAHVFDRFYRGSNAASHAKGSGLGLAIAKAVVETYEGKIKFETRSNDMIVVTVTLPIS